jgi:hypothetical protein
MYHWTVYTGVSFCGLLTLIFLSELNGLQTWSTDIGNAYLEAKTLELVYIIAHPKFGELEGQTLVIFKALYGLHRSGLWWYEQFADCLRAMGFWPSKAKPEIWMHRNGNVYEYIGVYVDDLAMVLYEPQEFVDLLTNKYRFKLKGTGLITFHLG